MKMGHFEGNKYADVVLYALSTCEWCKKTRKFLEGNKVDFNYIYVDLLDEDEKKMVEEVILKYNPRYSFPTILINNKDCVVGFQPEEIQKKLKF